MIGAVSLALALLTASPSIPARGPCRDSLDLSIFTSPLYPNKRARLTIVVAAEESLEGATLGALDPGGELHELEVRVLGGPPYGWTAHIEQPRAGAWRIGVGRNEELLACQQVFVRPAGGRMATREMGVDPVWTSRWKWERDVENLYSVWVEHLFDAPNDEQPSWRPLHEVLRSPDRNLLYDRMNLGEDGPREETAIKLAPDCADFPYHLRAYFAWKMQLPFAFRRCGRGNAQRAPRCRREFETNEMPAENELVVRGVQHFIQRRVGGSIHSSSPRTLPDDERSDFYPVRLTRRSVRPGAIFADPYGHILVVAKWVAQGEGTPGILFAVDAQPDKTVGRRRFWRGSFLFPEEGAVSGAGFKRFRPVRRTVEGEFIVHDNAWILANPKDYGDFSVEQWGLGKDGFYERMDELINPVPMKPEDAFRAALDALTEQVERRAMSVDAGEAWKAAHPERVIEMPAGPAIFQTAGPWEDYSTPSRDLRLLIAIQTVVDYPGRVVRFPGRFVLPSGRSAEEARQVLADTLMAEARRRTFEYTKSDGAKHTLSVADVIERRTALEMAYNPNDCPELRWGAPEDSKEYATCRTRAPEEQRQAMAGYRPWFAQRRRPLD